MRAAVLVFLLAAVAAAQGRGVREILADHARATGPMHTVRTLRATGRTTLGRRLLDTSTQYDVTHGHVVRRMMRGPVEYVGKAGVYYAEGEAFFRSRGGSNTARGVYYRQKILADPLPLRLYIDNPGLQAGLAVGSAPGAEVLRGAPDENGYYPLYFLDARTHLLTRVRWERDATTVAALAELSRHVAVDGVMLPTTMRSRAVLGREDEEKREMRHEVYERVDQVRRWELNPDLSETSFDVPGRGGGDAAGFRRAEFGTGVRPFELAVADVDGDGKRDVVVACERALAVHFGGEFERPLLVELATGQLRGVLIEDMDFDGQPEVVTMSRTGPPDILFRVTVGADRKPRIERMIGGPTFGSDLKGADFDRDGLPDLAATGYADRRLHVKFGNGVGAFRIRGLAPSLADDDPSRRGLGLAIGRLDGDDLLDILVADGKVIRPFMGKVNLAFLPGAAIEAGPRPVDACFADLDGDGRDDLVVANEHPVHDIKGDLAVLLNTGAGLRAHAKVEAGRRTPDVAAGDFDGDGNLDIIAPSFATGHVALLPGDGEGNLGPRRDLPAGRGAHRLAVADVDGDGRVDILCANRADDSIMVFYSEAGGAAPGAAGPRARPTPALEGVEFRLEGLTDPYEFVGEFRIPAEIRDPSGIAFVAGDPVHRSFLIVSDKRPALFRLTLDVHRRRLLVGPEVPLAGHKPRRLDLEGVTFDHASGNLFLAAEADSSILRANLFGHVLAEARADVAPGDNDGIEAIAVRRKKDGTPLLYVFDEREGKNLLGRPLVHVYGIEEDPFTLTRRARPFPLVAPDQTGAAVFEDRLYVLCRFRRAIEEFAFDGDTPRTAGKRSASYAALAAALGHDRHRFPIGEGLAIDAAGDLFLLLDNNGQETGLDGLNRGPEGRLLWFANRGPARQRIASRSVVVRQIFIPWRGAKGNPKVDATREEAGRMALECLKKLRAGADPGELAAKYGHADADWPLEMTILVPPGKRTRTTIFADELPRAFARLAFALEPGEAGLCEWHAEDSPWGFHVIVREK